MAGVGGAGGAAFSAALGGGALSYGGAAPPAPPPIDPGLYALFTAVDTDRSGQISAAELQKALSNGGWTPFDIRTVLLMIKMFDKDGSQQISPPEFAQLWKYLGDWKACFDAYDADKSGTIDMGELNSALQRMGYRLSAESFGNLVRAYDTDKSGTLGFDEFIRLFCELNLVTGAFAKFDVRREGRITITYDQYISLFMSTR